ncbi:MAG: HAD family hydrolase, partial [Nitrososphaera sp.]
ELFRERHCLEPRYWSGGRPLIKNDRLVVSRSTMKALHEMLGGNLAVVTGRSRLAAEYSLGPVMKYLRLDACVFLEDEKREFAKPNPYAIKHAMQTMGAKTALYAGDSAEDLLTARNAEKELGVRISFVGIYGYSPRPAQTLAKFKEQGVEAVAKSVDQLPRIIKKRSL